MIEDKHQSTDKQQSTIPPNNIDIFIPIEEGLIEKMKVAELRDELNIRELRTRGKKYELQDRLKKALTDKVHVRKLKPQHKPQHKQQKSEVGKDFPITAKWEVFIADLEQVKEPNNPTFHEARAPTVPAEDARNIPIKHNFSKYKFDIPKFTGIKEERKKLRGGGGRLGKEKIQVPFTKGFMKPSVIKKFKLTPNSLPHEWVDVFFSFSKNLQSVIGQQKKEEMLSIDLMTRWTSTKATMMGAGDSIYPDWKPFSRDEIRQHLGIYIFNGVAPYRKYRLDLIRNRKIQFTETI